MGPPVKPAGPKRIERKCSLTDVLSHQQRPGLKSAATNRRLEKLTNGVESQQRVVSRLVSDQKAKNYKCFECGKPCVFIAIKVQADHSGPQ